MSAFFKIAHILMCCETQIKFLSGYNEVYALQGYKDIAALARG